MSSRTHVKRKLANVVESVRKKYKSIKQHERGSETAISNIFKPITQSLSELKQSISSAMPPQVSLETKQKLPITKTKMQEKLNEGKKGKIKKEFDRHIPDQKRISIGNDDNDDDDYDDDSDKRTAEDTFEYDPAAEEDNEKIDEEAEEEGKEVEMEVSAKALDDYLQMYNPVSQDYVKGFLLNDENYDTTSYGMRLDDEIDKWYLGKSEVIFDEHGNITVEHKKFSGTTGLYELLFKSEPQAILEDDLIKYGEIIYLTNLNRQNYDPTEKIRGVATIKYLDFVKPAYAKYLDILQKYAPTPQRLVKIRHKSTPKSVSKKGAGNINVYDTKKIRFVYWNNVNELVSRLAILHAAIKAGNYSLVNELNSIVEELREADVIN